MRIVPYQSQCIHQGRFSQGFPVLEERRDRIGAFRNFDEGLKDANNPIKGILIRHYRPFSGNHKRAIDQHHR